MTSNEGFCAVKRNEGILRTVLRICDYCDAHGKHHGKVTRRETLKNTVSRLIGPQNQQGFNTVLSRKEKPDQTSRPQVASKAVDGTVWIAEVESTEHKVSRLKNI